MVCVPLFIMLTGFLMCQKELNKKYYKGIIKTLWTYLLAAVFVLLVQKYYFKYEIDFDSIFDITGIHIWNSWYVEMYIGLFLLIPFLNLIWKGLDVKKKKQALIATLLILTSLPSILNVWDMGNLSFWIKPSSSTDYDLIFPDYWIGIWPLTYYFLGSYIREFKPQISLKKGIILLLGIFVIFGSFNFYRNMGGVFEWAQYNDYYSIMTVINSVLIFIFCLQIKTEKIPYVIKKIILKISELSFGIYLVSSVFDKIIYAKLVAYVPHMIQRLEWYIIVVPLIFICSLITAQLLHILLNAFKGFGKLVDRIKYKNDYNKC